MTLTKGFLYFFSICKTFWFFVSFSQDWTKWGIHPHGGTFCFNSSSNISFPKRWTYSSFCSETSLTKMLCFGILPFQFLYFLRSYLLLRSKMLAEEISVAVSSTSPGWLFVSFWKPSRKGFLFCFTSLFNHLQGFFLGFGVI